MFCATASSLRACAAHEVLIDPQARFGYYGGRSFRFEGPCSVGRGIFEVDRLGAWSVLEGAEGERESFLRHVETIGRFCVIAATVHSGPGSHPLNWISTNPAFYGPRDWSHVRAFRERNPQMAAHAPRQYWQDVVQPAPKIRIGNDVRIGEGVFINRGVVIGDGALIAPHAVITRDVPPYAIVEGVPGRVVGYRFPETVIARLLDLRWWDYGLSAIDGVDFTDIETAIAAISENVRTGRAQLYTAPVLELTPDEVILLDPVSCAA